MSCWWPLNPALKVFHSIRLSLNTDRPAASASEVTTIWHYINSIIIIIIVIIIIIIRMSMQQKLLQNYAVHTD